MKNELRLKIDGLWEEVLKIRREEGKCRNSPQKEEAIRLMHQWALRSEEGRRYFQEKRTEIRWRLAEIELREGKYDSALLQVAKGLHLWQEIKDEDLMAKLKMTERRINMLLAV